MKFLDRVTLTIFADIMLIISIIVFVLALGWLDFGIVSDLCHKALTTEIPSKIILICSVIIALLSLKAIFFSSPEKNEKMGHGILLENEKGKLMISEETIQNLTNTVVKGFEGTEDVSTRISLDKEDKLMISINLSVKPGVIIKELSSNIQDKVKTTIKQVTDLEVQEVNIRIKNIAPKKSETNN